MTGLLAGNTGGGSAPPSNISPPVSSGAVYADLTLTTTNGTWTESPTGFTYQWQIDLTNGGGTFTDISGATSNTYVVLLTQEGFPIRCVVTASNAIGSSPGIPSNQLHHWIPADDPNRQLFLDSRDASTFTLNSGVNVVSWADKLGLKTTYESVSGRRPNRLATGPNGEQAVTFVFASSTTKDYVRADSDSEFNFMHQGPNGLIVTTALGSSAVNTSPIWNTTTSNGSAGVALVFRFGNRLEIRNCADAGGGQYNVLATYSATNIESWHTYSAELSPNAVGQDRGLAWEDGTAMTLDSVEATEPPFIGNASDPATMGAAAQNTNNNAGLDGQVMFVFISSAPTIREKAEAFQAWATQRESDLDPAQPYRNTPPPP